VVGVGTNIGCVGASVGATARVGAGASVAVGAAFLPKEQASPTLSNNAAIKNIFFIGSSVGTYERGLIKQCIMNIKLQEINT
jgi:hypothetical protein